VSPFKVVYATHPITPLDLTPRPLDQKPSADADHRVKEIQKLYEQVRNKIEQSNLFYSTHTNKKKKQKTLQPGDLVWIHLRKESFPARHKNKLMPRADGPFKILERISNNVTRWISLETMEFQLRST